MNNIDRTMIQSFMEALEPMHRFVRHYHKVKTPPSLQIIFEVDDLASIGFIVLLEALAKYDQSLGVSLWEYAKPRTLGAVKDALGRKSKDLAPRNLAEKALCVAEDKIRPLAIQYRDEIPEKVLDTLAFQTKVNLSDLRKLELLVRQGSEYAWLMLSERVDHTSLDDETLVSDSMSPFEIVSEKEYAAKIRTYIASLDPDVSAFLLNQLENPASEFYQDLNHLDKKRAGKVWKKVLELREKAHDFLKVVG